MKVFRDPLKQNRCTIAGEDQVIQHHFFVFFVLFKLLSSLTRVLCCLMTGCCSQCFDFVCLLVVVLFQGFLIESICGYFS